MEEPKAIPFLLFNVVGEEVVIELNSDAIPLFNSIQDDLVTLSPFPENPEDLCHDHRRPTKNREVLLGQ